MKVAVFGGCGFVGRRFTRRLLDEGHEVTVVDNLSTGKTPDLWMYKPQSVAKQRMLFCDVRTYCNSFQPNRNEYFDLVIHLAAVVGGRLNIENDPLGVATDLSIDSELFSWAVKCNPRPKVIYFSSSAAYPIDLQGFGFSRQLAEHDIDFDEDFIGKPDMTYGWSKLSGEYLAQYAAQKYGLDVKIYRPFGGYGEDQDWKTYPFPAIIKRIMDGDDPVTVWGSGDQQRDFIHIEDVVTCVLNTMDKLQPGEALNIGSGVGTSFHDLAKMAGEVVGREFTIVCDKTKPEGVFSRVADATKMLSMYNPQIGLDHGIAMVARALKPVDKPQEAA